MKKTAIGISLVVVLLVTASQAGVQLRPREGLGDGAKKSILKNLLDKLFC
jgi:hypothetical protein